MARPADRDAETLLYFAFGSNLWTRRLQSRVPSGRVVTTGYVEGYALRFHKRGLDDSAKCNAHRTRNPADLLHGVVFEMDRSEKPTLDRIEGPGYTTVQVEVRTTDGPMQAFCYVAEPDAIDETMRPYSWYRDFVCRGAEAHGFETRYVDAIRAIEAMDDPDRERDRRERMLLDDPDE